MRGAWLIDESQEGLLLIAPAGDEPGKVTLASVEIKDAEGLKLDRHAGVLTRLGDEADLYYLNLSGPDTPAQDGAKAEPRRYLVILLRIKPALITAWPIKPQAVAEAVEKKELPGTIERSEDGQRLVSVRVEADPEALDQWFLRHGKALFNLESPITARRVATLQNEK